MTRSLFPYWNGKDFTPNFIKALPFETRQFAWGSDPNNVGTKFSFVIISTSTMRHSQNWVIDFGKLLTRGCKGMREELENVVKHIMIQNYLAAALKPKYIAAPLASMLHDLCMENGRDLHTHADYIPGALDASCIDGLGGFATCIDSLAAIKHLIFDTKKLTWDQLLEALEKNWEGKEAIRQLCLNAPKYGNGIEWVDAIGYEIQRTVMEYAHNHPRPHGQSANMRIIPITFHNPSGKVTMATPNGRSAGEFLSDGIVPSHGCDTKGPTVTLESIARATCHIYKEHREDLLNMTIVGFSVVVAFIITSLVCNRYSV